MGGRALRVACITVERPRPRFQRFFEFFPTKCNCLVVVVRTNNFEIHAVSHKPPPDRAMRRTLRLLEQLLSVLNDSANGDRWQAAPRPIRKPGRRRGASGCARRERS